MIDAPMPSYRITLDGRDLSFDCAPGQTLLDAAETAGIALLSGCRQGACRTCVAELKSGKVQIPEGTSLTPALLERHLLLTCVTTPLSDVVIDAGSGERPLDPSLIRPWTD